MDTDTMIHVLAQLTCEYKKYPLPAGIHFQYQFFTRCGFYQRIPTCTNFLTSLIRIKLSLVPLKTIL